MKKRMNILLTGGAGFIGSHFCDFIVEKGHKVTVIDDLSTGKMENLALVKDKIQFIKGKLEEVNLNAAELGEFDAIVHLAAQASVPLSIANFEESSKTNLLGTIHVLEYFRLDHIPLVYASSSAFYSN